MPHRADWLPRVLAGAGLTVVTLPGWESRGRDVADWRAVVWHHTATSPRSKDEDVARLLRDGRHDLAGPLCQLGLDRQGRFWLVAAGRGNHNVGTYGNNSLGIEAFNDGIGEPWPAAQRAALVRGTAAILEHLNLPTGRCVAHRETDPTRKIDPAGIDMATARREVDATRTAGAPDEEDDMTDADRKMLRELHKEVTAFDDGTLRWMLGRTHHIITTDPSSLAKAIKDEVGPDVARRVAEELRK